MSERNTDMELEPKGAAAAASVEMVETIDNWKNVARSEDSARDLELESTHSTAAAASWLEKVEPKHTSTWKYSGEDTDDELLEKYIKKVMEYVYGQIEGKEMGCARSLELLSELEDCLSDIMQSKKEIEIRFAAGMESVPAEQEMYAVASTSQEDGYAIPQGTSKDSETKKQVGNHVDYYQIESAPDVLTSFVYDHSVQLPNGKVQNLELKKKAKHRNSFLNCFTKCCRSKIEDENEDDEDLELM